MVKVQVEGHRNLVTAVGNIVAPAPGEVLEMSGEWTSHPQFGPQFSVASCKTSVPASVTGIRKYLGGGLIRGIGPVMAKRIAAKFGKDTLDIIDKDPERLLEVEGIGRTRIKMIAEAWTEQRDIHSVMVFLHEQGVSSAYASKIYKTYGNAAVDKVRKNPYQLAFDISGISFGIADKIAKNLGADEKSPQRAAAGITFLLQEAGDNGHVFSPLSELIANAEEKLNIEKNILEEAVQSLKNNGRIFIDHIVKNKEESDAVYLAGNYLSEVRIAEKLCAIYNHPRHLKDIYSVGSMNYAQQMLQIELADKQKEAVRSAVTNKITVITGGPGTGKTTITRAILEIFSLITNKIFLAAPTGRAAKRMSEATGYTAKTIHRLLEFNPFDGGFKRSDKNPLACDVLIIDEASMIDNSLMYHLLKAVPETAAVILIGDTDQLPSVGAGNVLKDIINSRVFPVIKLDEIFRQSQSSKIVMNAHNIINGKCPKVDKDFTPDSDFFFFQEDDVKQIFDGIITMVKSEVPEDADFDPVRDVQVLSPMNKGVMGTIALNEALQDALNPDGFEIARMGRRLRVGDKVMQIKNNYSKNVYNGDIGIISDIDTENQVVAVEFDDIPKSYEYSELDELTLAYAVSIHKSQGSEYPIVIMPITMNHYIMLQRNLIYTGVTRGRRLVIIIGSPAAMKIAVKNNKVAERNTRLEQRLRGLYDESI